MLPVAAEVPLLGSFPVVCSHAGMVPRELQLRPMDIDGRPGAAMQNSAV